VRSSAYNSNPPSRRSTRQLRDREAEVTAPNWTIGAFSAATSPLLAKAPYLYRVMTQGGPAWALRTRGVFCLGIVEPAPCP
jgi:hypothetical protein